MNADTQAAHMAVRLPDGFRRQFGRRATGMRVTASTGQEFAGAAWATGVDGELRGVCRETRDSTDENFRQWNPGGSESVRRVGATGRQGGK